MLNDELFLVRERMSVVEAWDMVTLTLRSCFWVSGLVEPCDIASSYKYSCIYISDIKDNFIHRLQLVGTTSKWKAKNALKGFPLAPTDVVLSSLVRMPGNSRNTRQGKFCRKIRLPDLMSNPSHAIKLTDGSYVVCHGGHFNFVHGVGIINENGQLLKHYWGRAKLDSSTASMLPGQINYPVRVAVNRDGFIFVADDHNKRIVLLNSSLNFIRDFVFQLNCSMFSRRMCLDKKRKCIYIANNTLKPHRNYDILMVLQVKHVW